MGHGRAGEVSPSAVIGAFSVSNRRAVLPTGSEIRRFHALGPIYYRDSDGALLVYDITDKDSFQKTQKWVKELRSIVGPDIVIMIAGNKIDLERKRTVTTDEAEV